MIDIVEWLRGDRDWPDGTKAGMLIAAAEIERLRAALNGVLAREMEWAGHQGLSDCRCINLSRGAEREYERGECPHQKARHTLEGK